jgi:hypothetical protein
LGGSGDFKGPYTAEELRKLRELRVVGDPTQVLDEATKRLTTVGGVLAVPVGPAVFAVAPGGGGPPPIMAPQAGMRSVPPVIGAASQAAAPTAANSTKTRTDACKICGAPRDPLNTNCKFCGTAYQINDLTGETYVNALRTILTRIDEGERSTKSMSAEITSALAGKMYAGADAKVSAISTFAMPSDVESLLQFLAFCHGNAQMIVAFNDFAGDRVKGAWHGKAKMAFTQLKMKAIGNPALAPYIAEYEALYGAMARKPLSGQAKFIIGLGAVFVVLMTFIGIMASGESKDNAREKGRLDAIVQKVQAQIAAGDYDGAEASCADVSWTWDNVRNEAQVKAYDEKRQELKAVIAEARKNSNKR